MISRLRTCFSLTALALAPAFIPLAGAAELSGSVQLVASSDLSVRNHRDFSGVVVWLRSTDNMGEPAPKRVRMIQKDKRFDPHVLAIGLGSVVDFPNFDPIFHNAFSNFNGKIFDIGLYPPGSTRSIRFDRPGVVRVFCNIHPTMSALIDVLESPYFATTDDNGHFEISSVPDGAYEVHFLHERALPETLKSLTRLITVSGKDIELPIVDISEAGYLPMPHRNKYGQAYRPAPDDQTYSTPLQ
jgi:plastocyanin